MKIIKFYAIWCGPCKAMTTILENVDLTGVELVEVDIEKEPELSDRYGISSVPVLVFEKDGEELERVIGILPPEVIEEKLAGLRVLEGVDING